MIDNADPSGIWTRYWRAGALHSCGCAYPGNYEGAVARFWEAQFSRLPDHARIVDVGTGNGAIPLLASAAARRLGRAWQIHGVDLADIDPAAVDPAAADPADANSAAANSAAADPARFAGIVFHPRTSATALPFPDASVALLTGHYAFEYLPRAPMLAELDRVLCAHGGAVALVLHARDSALLATTAEQLAHCRALFEEIGLFDAVAWLAERLADAPTEAARRALADDADAVAAREAVNAAAARVSERIARAATPDILQLALGRSSEALQNAHRWGVERTLQALQAAQRELTDERERLRDLDAAALDRAGVEQLADELSACGLKPAAIGTLTHEGGQRLGWSLTASR